MWLTGRSLFNFVRAGFWIEGPAGHLRAMDRLEYSELVRRLTKPGGDVVAALTPERANFWHMATGVSTEAGELLDAAKKHVIYNRPLDRENAVEELGDIEFYMEGVRQFLGVSREEVLAANAEKLARRYSRGYSDAAAQARADKADAPPS